MKLLDLFDKILGLQPPPRPTHNWTDNGLVEEEGISSQWARRRITCTRCGQQRLIYWALELDDPLLQERCHP